MDRGLWRYTRHPNYFGDFCVWWGFYLLALAAGAWWSIAGPALMSFLLLRVSGVSLLERTSANDVPATPNTSAAPTHFSRAGPEPDHAPSFLASRPRRNIAHGRALADLCRASLECADGLGLPAVGARHRLPAGAVRRCVLWRAAGHLPRLRAPAALDLQPGTGRVLHDLDVLRRGRHGRPRWLGLPADLPGPGAVAAVRLTVPRAARRDRPRAQHHLDRGPDLVAVRQEPVAGSARRRHRVDGGRALPGAAVQSRRHQHRRTDRLVPASPMPGITTRRSGSPC